MSSNRTFLQQLHIMQQKAQNGGMLLNEGYVQPVDTGIFAPRTKGKVKGTNGPQPDLKGAKPCGPIFKEEEQVDLDVLLDLSEEEFLEAISENEELLAHIRSLSDEDIEKLLESEDEHDRLLGVAAVVDRKATEDVLNELNELSDEELDELLSEDEEELTEEQREAIFDRIKTLSDRDLLELNAAIEEEDDGN